MATRARSHRSQTSTPQSPRSICCGRRAEADWGQLAIDQRPARRRAGSRPAGR